MTFDCGFSDCQNMVCVSTKLHVPPKHRKVIYYRTYKKFNDDTFKKDLSYVAFHVSEVFGDIDD